MIAFLVYMVVFTGIVSAGCFLFGFFTKSAELHKWPDWAVSLAGIVGWLIPFALLYSLTR